MENSDKEKNNESYSRYNRKVGFYYSFLTVVLVFCLIQIGYGAILNISKIISYQSKSIILENHLKKVKLRNEDLKAEKKMITSDNSLEGIARNNLKMAGQDEVLVIINKKVEKPKKKKFQWKKFKNQKIKEKEVKPTFIPDIPEQVDEE
ncbi:septum formation initiator family protein [bacterium]|nr:septum formation initiator family protein [bacterium]